MQAVVVEESVVRFDDGGDGREKVRFDCVDHGLWQQGCWDDSRENGVEVYIVFLQRRSGLYFLEEPWIVSTSFNTGAAVRMNCRTAALAPLYSG